jgi:hypothetical protein
VQLAHWGNIGSQTTNRPGENRSVIARSGKDQRALNSEDNHFGDFFAPFA